MGDARFDGGAGPRAGGGQPKKSRVGDEALGRSRGGLSTKVHMLADARGRPVHAVLGAGQQHDCRRALELLRAVGKTGKVLADKAYDTNQVLAAVEALGAEAVIPSPPRRHVPRVVDLTCYRQRNQIERLMSRLKQFRRLATRYDKTASSYLGFVHFVCALLWLR
ncbi:MAG: IS5 family transposase [Janthinobacterium lividum]